MDGHQPTADGPTATNMNTVPTANQLVKLLLTLDTKSAVDRMFNGFCDALLRCKYTQSTT